MVQAFSRAEPSFAAPSLGWGAAHLPSLGRKQTQVLTSHPRPLGPGGVQCSERLATAGGGTVLLVSEPSPERCFWTHGCRLLTSVRSRAQGRERPAGQHAGAPAGLVAPSVHGKPWSAWVALRWPAGLWAGGRSLMSEIGPQAPRGWTLVKCPCPRMLCPGTMRFPVSQPPNGAQDAAASWGRGGCWSPGSLWAGRGLGISLSPPWSCLEQWGALPLGGALPGTQPRACRRAAWVRFSVGLRQCLGTCQGAAGSLLVSPRLACGRAELLPAASPPLHPFLCRL